MNIGIINQDLLNLDLALEYFKRSLKIREELNDQRGICWEFWGIYIFLPKKSFKNKKRNSMIKAVNLG